ncbi:ABC transporter permease [Aquabacterium sp.]|uniref:PhnE/PtxC family ABC transporter permease n=1 Tax=Aquabacterium sp. TaxID=1872578 RepID=UPI0025C70EB7|nr:ABC transporter permease subunit [Aquabacterium sp.]
MNASERGVPEGLARARRAMWQRNLVWLLIGLSGWLCLHLTGADPGKLWDADGVRNAADIFSGLAHPDTSPDFLARVLTLSIESLLIGVLGTVMAVVLGMGVAFFAIRVPELPEPPRTPPAWQLGSLAALRWLARLLLNVCRSVPEIVWAYVFVRLIGLGPGAAVLAIGLTVGGNIGKLYAELAEAVDPRPVQALRATGASRWAVFLHGVLPQVGRQWLGYALFCLECNIRIGTILGVVGAGGLGSEIALSLRYFEYNKLATTLMAVLAFVVVLEWLSAQLRQRALAWSVGLATLGSAWALHQLDIPWADLWHSDAPPLFTLDHLAPDAVFLRTVGAQVGETLMMAWVATLLSAGLAFVLAPLAATPLMTGSYLADPPRFGWATRLRRQAGLWGSRAFLQGTRVIPELTLALVFVVWVGGGPLAGILAIAVHNIGVMGRLFADVLEEVEPGPPAALQAQGAGTLGTFLFGVLPQVRARLAAFTLYRFEVNVRATAMVGFVGAGGIGDALNTAISLFHLRDLTLLLLTMLALVAVVDALGDRLRSRILNGPGLRERTRQRTMPEHLRALS